MGVVATGRGSGPLPRQPQASLGKVDTGQEVTP